MSALLLALLAWIGGQTGYAVPSTVGELPAVERLDPTAMGQVVYPQASRERLRQRTILGAYDVHSGINGTIYLSTDLDLADRAATMVEREAEPVLTALADPALAADAAVGLRLRLAELRRLM